MKKPTAVQIRKVAPLSSSVWRSPDPLARCHVCGEPSSNLRAHREHDEYDRPLEGAGRLVFIDPRHLGCLDALQAHPRLYDEERGEPGHLPLVCGPCVHRDGLDCRCPLAKANGGPGIRLSLDTMSKIICTRGLHRPVSQVVECTGRALRGPDPKETDDDGPDHPGP